MEPCKEVASWWRYKIQFSPLGQSSYQEDENDILGKLLGRKVVYSKSPKLSYEKFEKILQSLVKSNLTQNGECILESNNGPKGELAKAAIEAGIPDEEFYMTICMTITANAITVMTGNALCEEFVY